MATDQPDPDLLLLALNLSDSEPEEALPPSSNTTRGGGGPTTEFVPTRADRTALSEEAFQSLKQSYRPKVENGNLYKTTPLPSSFSSSSSSSVSTPTPFPKPHAQALLHAAEELYFFRRYAEAVSFLRKVLDSCEEEEKGAVVDPETRRLLGYYLERCLARLETSEEGGS